MLAPTKAETKILAKVRRINLVPALAGLGTSPDDSNFTSKQMRFVRRLHDAGKIVWVKYTGKWGAGWALPEFVEKFAA